MSIISVVATLAQKAQVFIGAVRRVVIQVGDRADDPSNRFSVLNPAFRNPCTWGNLVSRVVPERMVRHAAAFAAIAGPRPDPRADRRPVFRVERLHFWADWHGTS